MYTANYTQIFMIQYLVNVGFLLASKYNFKQGNLQTGLEVKAPTS